jgi:hypothetical protein
MTYFKQTIVSIINKWLASPIIANIIKFLLGVWAMIAGVHNFFYGITLLVVVDVISGILASLKKGEKFSSKKLRKGLLERFIIYNTMLIIIWVIESMVKQSFSYDNWYVVTFVGVMIGSYEISSIIENLVVINPEFAFLRKVSRVLNLLEDKAEQRVGAVMEINSDGKGQEEAG